MYKAQASEVTLLLKIIVPNFKCFVNVDKHKLSQVVRNLVSNGLKFCKKNSGRITVDVDVITHSTYLDIVNEETPQKNEQQDKQKAKVTDTSSSLSNKNIQKYLRIDWKNRL